MTNRFLISVAAIALVAGAGSANAQGGSTDREGGAAMQKSMPSGRANTGGATTQKSTEPSSGTKSTQSEEKSSGTAKGRRAEEPGQKSKNLSTESESKGTAKDMKAEGREGRDKNMKAESHERQDKNMKAEGREGQDKMKAEGREGQDKNMKAEERGRETTTQTRTDERSQSTTGQAGAAAKLSTEQRTKITTVIRNEHVAPVNNVDFSISVGTRIPRERISLRPLPVEVVTIYPEWRGYEFFLVRDEIIVVDPKTLEIVAVLPA
jgi:hypothetical protein